MPKLIQIILFLNAYLKIRKQHKYRKICKQNQDVGAQNTCYCQHLYIRVRLVGSYGKNNEESVDVEN